jgi:hypothetical protein
MAAGFDPKSGSVRPKQPMLSPLPSFGIQWSFCSCVAQTGVAELQLLTDQTIGNVTQAGEVVVGEAGAEEMKVAHFLDEVPGEHSLPGPLLDIG